jgi:hypothetical protein
VNEVQQNAAFQTSRGFVMTVARGAATNGGFVIRALTASKSANVAVSTLTRIS